MHVLIVASPAYIHIILALHEHEEYGTSTGQQDSFGDATCPKEEGFEVPIRFAKHKETLRGAEAEVQLPNELKQYGFSECDSPKVIHNIYREYVVIHISHEKMFMVDGTARNESR